MLYVIGSAYVGEFAEFDLDAAPNSVILSEGRQVARFSDRLELRLSKKLVARLKTLDVLPVVAPFLAISEPFKQLLEQECPDCAQFFPLSLVDKKNDSPDIQFWALNATRAYSAIDLGLSTYRSVPRHDDPTKALISYFRRIVVISEVSDAPMLFREENFTSFLVVREELVRAINARGLSVGVFPLENMGMHNRTL